MVPRKSVSTNLLDGFADYDTGKVITVHEGLPSDLLDRVGDKRRWHKYTAFFGESSVIFPDLGNKKTSPVFLSGGR